MVQPNSHAIKVKAENNEQQDSGNMLATKIRTPNI